MKLVSISQMQNADKYTINVLGIPGRILMQKAAESIAQQVLLKAEGNLYFKTAIFCGPGNNGGDGWATALILYEKGIDVVVFSCVQLVKLSGDAAYYAKNAEKTGVKIFVGQIPNEIAQFDIVIDAVFGIGLNRKVDGIYEEYISYINECAGFVISADIPSGLFSDEGIPYSTAVKADLTVCFGRAKVSLFSEPGCSYSKKVVVSEIGIPEQAYEDSDISYATTDYNFVSKRLIPREKISSKGKYGRVLIAAGSPGMMGAVSLCAESCFRSGTGLVYFAAPKSKLYEYDALIREAIAVPVEDCGKGFVSLLSAKDILAETKNKSALIIGPGLSPESQSEKIISHIVKNSNIQMIIDAQSINDISKDLKIFKQLGKNTVLTPHPGEMSRLIGKSVSYIQNNRIKVSVKFAQTYGVIVLLKGHRTIVTDGKRVFFNTTGNPGMATAGSGDVLTGVIASFASVIDDPVEAVAVATYIHGDAGDRMAEKIGEYGMKAGDIISEIPQAIKMITGA